MVEKRRSRKRAAERPAHCRPKAPGQFAIRVVAWQKRHGRQDLPWQRSRDPYAIWVSEVMLQQTQVATVTPFFERFMRHFPDVRTLASAPLDHVMQCWSGLGYYSRARNLHRAAAVVLTEHGGVMPRDAAALEGLPGIGRSTAGAIAALAYGERCAILDGNVRRVLSRYFAVAGDAGSSPVERELWRLAEGLVPTTDVDVYTQGMMDIGATVCVRARPKCTACPLCGDCRAHLAGRANAFPQPRKRPPVPERSVAMMLLYYRGEVLLEKRPAHGVWGGLWSLPEAPVEDSPQEFCARHLGADAGEVVALPVVVHAFTHFRLRIQPWSVEVRALRPRTAEPGRMWLKPCDARAAALPAPVRRILENR